jgi:hypothetical protein
MSLYPQVLGLTLVAVGVLSAARCLIMLSSFANSRWLRRGAFFRSARTLRARRWEWILFHASLICTYIYRNDSRFYSIENQTVQWPIVIAFAALLLSDSGFLLRSYMQRRSAGKTT